MLTRRVESFELVRLCCTPFRLEAEDRAIEDAALSVFWPDVLALAKRHRVDALVYAALRRAGVPMPEDQLAILAARARRIAFDGLALAAESNRLCDLAEEAGVSPVILKGTPLALLAHGGVHLKHAKDIDMAIASAEQAAVRAVLVGAGYRLWRPSTGKDEGWYHPDRAIEVELHTALVDHPAWLRGLAIDPTLRRERVGAGRGLPTLARDDLFAYLCVHGAAHGWARLKWLADLAALLADRSEGNITALHAYAVTLGAGRASAQALLLCADLLGTRLAPDFGERLRRSATTRWLTASAHRAYTDRHSAAELDTRPLSTLRIHLAHLLITEGWTARWHLLTAKLGGGNAARLGARWLARRIATARQLRRHQADHVRRQAGPFPDGRIRAGGARARTGGEDPL